MGKPKLFDLGDHLRDTLEDFCRAHYDASQVSVVRIALKTFIEERLAAEPEMRKRFEHARAERLGSNRGNVRLVKANTKEK